MFMQGYYRLVFVSGCHKRCQSLLFVLRKFLVHITELFYVLDPITDVDNMNRPVCLPGSILSASRVGPVLVAYSGQLKHDRPDMNRSVGSGPGNSHSYSGKVLHVYHTPYLPLRGRRGLFEHPIRMFWITSVQYLHSSSRLSIPHSSSPPFQRFSIWVSSF